MKLVKLNDCCTVNPLEISEVTINDYGNITVRMRSGAGHSVPNDWGDRGGYTTHSRLIGEINAAMGSKGG